MGSAAFLTPVFLFGSIRGGSGKSSIVAHLATYLQSRGRKVAIIDANTAFPQQLRAAFPRAISLETYADLVELATEGTSRFRRTFFFTPTDRVSYFPAFRLGDPVRLLTDASLRDFFLQLRSQFDVVLINLSPGGEAFVAAESFLQRRGGEAGCPAGVLITTTDARSLLLLDALLRSRSALPHLARERLLFVYNRLPRGVEDATIDGPRLGWSETKQVFRLPISLGLAVMDEIPGQALEAAPIVHRESSALRQAMATLARTLFEVAEGQWQTDQAAGDPEELAPCLDPQLLERLGRHVEPLQRRLVRHLYAPGVSVAGFIEAGPSVYRIRLRLSGTGHRVFPPLLEIGYPPPTPVAERRIPVSFTRPPVDAPPPASFRERTRPPAIQVKPQYQFDDRFASSMGSDIHTYLYYMYVDGLSEPKPEWRGYIAPADIPTLDQLLGFRKRSARRKMFTDRPAEAAPQPRPAHIPTEFAVSVILNGHDAPFWRWDRPAPRDPRIGFSGTVPRAEREPFSIGFRPVQPPVVKFHETRSWRFTGDRELIQAPTELRIPQWVFTDRHPERFAPHSPAKMPVARHPSREDTAPRVTTLFSRAPLHLRHPAIPAGHRFPIPSGHPGTIIWPPSCEPGTELTGISRMRPPGLLFPGSTFVMALLRITPATPPHIAIPVSAVTLPPLLHLHFNCSELLDAVVLPTGVTLGRPSFRTQHRPEAYLEPAPLSLPVRFGMAPVLIGHHLPDIRWGSLLHRTTLPPSAPHSHPISFEHFLPMMPPVHPGTPVAEVLLTQPKRTTAFSVKLRPFSHALRSLPFQCVSSSEFSVRSVFPSVWSETSIDIYLGVHRHHSEPFLPIIPDKTDILRLLRLPALELRRRVSQAWRSAWLPVAGPLRAAFRVPQASRAAYRHLYEPDNQFPLPGFGVRRSIGSFISFDPGLSRTQTPREVGMSHVVRAAREFSLHGYQPVEAWFHDIPRPYRFLTSYPLHLQLHGNIVPKSPAHDWPFHQAAAAGPALAGPHLDLPAAPPYYSLFNRIDIDTNRTPFDLAPNEAPHSILPLPHEAFSGLTLHERKHLESRPLPRVASLPLRHHVYLPELLGGRGTFGFPKFSGVDLLFSHLAVLCRQHLARPITFNEPFRRRSGRPSNDRIPLAMQITHAPEEIRGSPVPGIPSRIRQNFQRKQTLMFTRVQDLREAVRLTQASLSRLVSKDPS